MSSQMAFSFGIPYHACGCCGRPLTAEESVMRGIGPVCAGKGKGATSMAVNSANFEVMEDRPGGALVIRDLGPWDQFPTVTNAAEKVIRELHARGLILGQRQVLYYDSEGQLDELLHDEARFLGFKAGPR